MNLTMGAEDENTRSVLAAIEDMRKVLEGQLDKND